jgi:uncharacterized membrane protein HdeD (DUF308 family)
MSEEEKAPNTTHQISSRAYFILAAISFLVGVPLYFFVHPIALVAAVVVGIFLMVGGFFSMANEKRWLD